MFLRYLVEFEGVKSDYSTVVPHYTKPYVIPSVYSVEEISAIEETIDTGTIAGKRELRNASSCLKDGDAFRRHCKIKDCGCSE